MKLSLAIMASAQALTQERQVIRSLNQARAEKRMRFPADRFVYQYPLCETIEQCVEEHEKCDGQVFNESEQTGTIEHRGYSDFFNCQWQINAPEGKTVGLKFFNDFDLEWHRACGYDRVHIRCLDDKDQDYRQGQPISRLCGPNNQNHNYAYDALKMMPKKSFFKESTDTGCQKVLIEFNTDQDTQGQTERTGFTLGFYHTDCVGDNCPSDDVCANGGGSLNVIQCLRRGAKNAARAEYKKLIAAEQKPRKKQTLIRIEATRMARADMHIDNYMRKMTQTVGRCGRGHSASFETAFYQQMRAADASGSADQMFAIWNLFAVRTLTGEDVTCGWYNGAGDEAIEESSFPCRTRRLFLKLQGKTQFGQYTECQAADFDINKNQMF